MSKANKTRKCPVCGAAMPQNVKYCRRCHARMDSGRIGTVSDPRAKAARDPLADLPKPIRPEADGDRRARIQEEGGGDNAPAYEDRPGDNAPAREDRPGDNAPAREDRSGDGVPFYEDRPDGDVPAFESRVRPESTARGPGYRPPAEENSSAGRWQMFTVLAIIVVIVAVAVVLVVRLNRPSDTVTVSADAPANTPVILTVNTAEPEATDSPATTPIPADEAVPAGTDAPDATEAPEETADPSASPSPTPTPGFDVEAADDTVYINGDGVYIRMGPGTTYDVISSESTGYELHRTGRTDNNWSQVEYNGYVGYVSDSLITTEKPESTPAPTYDVETASGKVTVRTASNLRTGPGEDYAVQTTVSAGTELDRTGTSGDWTRVTYDGKELYIYTELVGSFDVSDDSGTLTVTSAANIRVGPGTDYDSLGVASQGTKLTCTGKSGSWYEVDYNGKTGYISSGLVNKS